MESAKPLEPRPSLLGPINRLRAISSLILVAIEHEDMRRLQELVAESGQLVEMVTGEAEEQLPDDVRSLVEQIVRTNRRVLEELELRRLDIGRQLAEVRRQKRQVAGFRRSVKEGSAAPSYVDRRT